MEETTKRQDLPPAEGIDTGIEWVSKLRYSRSFTAKLIVSDLRVKEWYAALVTKLLSYDKVKSRLNWTGVSFLYGRTLLARVVFSGKTLCLYLAVDPNLYQKGRYKFKDVSGKKKFAPCPAMIRITSGRALAFVVDVIDKMASERGFSLHLPAMAPIQAKDFPLDSFNNLLSRGLIRILHEPKKTVYGGYGSAVPTPEPVDHSKPLSEECYQDTLLSNEALVNRHEEYDVILKFLRSETAEIKLVKRYIVKTIDEKWIAAIEDSLNALDDCLRKPTHFIQETEELLPIERTKKVTPRSIKHLCEHTGLIAKATDDEIVPTHLLNVFRDDSMMTYENKFLNTLLHHLYIFVSDRYEQALKNGSNERVSVLTVTDRFTDGPVRGRFSCTFEVAEPHGENVRNSVKTKDLWRRVVKLKEIVGDYFKSELAVNLGNAFIRPPVVRTNAILKNPNMRQCLTLWEFIESYEDEGNGITMEEKEEKLSEEHTDMIYRGLAEQYLVLRRNTTERAVFTAGRQWAAGVAEQSEEKTVFSTRALSVMPEVGTDEGLLMAIEAAIAADEYIDGMTKKEQEKRRKERETLLKATEENNALEYASSEAVAAAEEAIKAAEETAPRENEENEPAEERDEEIYIDAKKSGPHKGAEVIVQYKKSMEAKLRLSDDQTKEYYCEIYNAFMSKNKVWVRKGFNSVTFSGGRKTLARMMIVGKTLRVYFALDPATLPMKYHVKDSSDVRRYTLTPAMLKVKSARSLGIALQLVETVCQGLGENEKDVEKIAVSLFGKETVDRLVEMGLMQKIMTEPKENAAVDLSGAEGDALLPREEAEHPETVRLSIEKKENKRAEETEGHTSEEKAGGDALGVKPIAIDELEAYEKKKAEGLSASRSTEEKEEEQKKTFWSRLFKRKK